MAWRPPLTAGQCEISNNYNGGEEMTISQVAAAAKTMLVINSAMEPDARQKLVVDTRARQRTTDFDPPWDFNQLNPKGICKKGKYNWPEGRNTIDKNVEIGCCNVWPPTMGFGRPRVKMWMARRSGKTMSSPPTTGDTLHNGASWAWATAIIVIVILQSAYYMIMA